MKIAKLKKAHIEARRLDDGQRGTAALTAVLIMSLLAIFTAASLSRVTTEAVVMANDYSNTQAFYAAQASLEQMSRNFNKIFDVRLRPTAADLDNIRSNAPNLAAFNFNQAITQTATDQIGDIREGPFSGLVSIYDQWRLDSTATYANGAQVQLTRTFFNHRIPIFQFGIFYDDDLEIHPGPSFNFGGRVHSNRNIFMMSGSDLRFRSRVTAAGEIVYDVARNGVARASQWNGRVYVADQNGIFRQVTKGSVINGPDTSGTDPDMPNGSVNTSWQLDSSIFGGNLLARQRELRLPLQIDSNHNPIELLKRERADDTEVLRASRYYDMPGIRITLSDSQAKLPGGAGGVQLDGNPGDGVRGYIPPPMRLPTGGAYQATRFNGYRLYTGTSYDGQPRQTWIKIELVSVDEATLQPTARDVTADFLSLGFTEKAMQVGLNNDDRAIVKLQRYVIPGPPVKVAPANVNNTTNTPVYSQVLDPRDGANRAAYSYNTSSGGFSYVATSIRNAANQKVSNNAAASAGETSHEVQVTIGLQTNYIVPFPIKMYDAREGLYNDSISATTWAATYTDSATNSSRVPACGVMSLVDIDMFNLGRFLRGDWDGQFRANAALPGGSLSSDDVSNNNGDGWIVYVSDHRGDADNDGEYDMEDIFGPNDGVFQFGEDANHDGILETDYNWESARYTQGIESDVAAVNALSSGPQGWQVYADRYFRRASRVINGETLFGTQTRGYAVASENAVYILGNFNATGVVGTGNPIPPEQYTGSQVPSSISADAVVFLSREWSDGKSFRWPFTFGDRRVTSAGQTTVRAALLMGDTMSRLAATPDQGGSDANLSGGVHNFIRFLESWGTRVNYCGSLINLFNSRNNNGPHKCCSHVYGAPERNWTFDTSFLNSDRLPPGTPFFQFAQMTGFRQTVRQLN